VAGGVNFPDRFFQTLLGMALVGCAALLSALAWLLWTIGYAVYKTYL
jgi:hypothetical protein